MEREGDRARERERERETEREREREGGREREGEGENNKTNLCTKAAIFITLPSSFLSLLPSLIQYPPDLLSVSFDARFLNTITIIIQEYIPCTCAYVLVITHFCRFRYKWSISEERGLTCIKLQEKLSWLVTSPIIFQETSRKNNTEAAEILTCTSLLCSRFSIEGPTANL